ncbi:MAG TPA: hypothetical protein DC017_10820 [Candidatus Wallbacteria bacterium]|nr:hypothetical protein [Candidatus Wallbacteria bacterium]
MLSIRLSEEMENKLRQISIATKRPKSYFVKEALTNYLDDLEDFCVAIDRVSKPNAKYLKSKNVRKRSGL